MEEEATVAGPKAAVAKAGGVRVVVGREVAATAVVVMVAAVMEAVAAAGAMTAEVVVVGAAMALQGTGSRSIDQQKRSCDRLSQQTQSASRKTIACSRRGTPLLAWFVSQSVTSGRPDCRCHSRTRLS